jgi:putative transposase
MFRTFKYRLRPEGAQTKSLDYLLWQARLVYNAALEQRITVYQQTGKSVHYTDQWGHFRDLRREQADTLGQLNATCLQQMLRRLDKAFAAFFRRVKAGETPGFPRFKGCNRFKSLEFTYGDGCKLRVNPEGRASCYVQNVGELRLAYHRPVPTDATIKHVVVKQTAGRWYVCLMLALPDPAPVAEGQPIEKPVGVDAGLKSLLALSDGTLVDNPRWLRESLAKLRRLQRHAARQMKGSHRQRDTYAQIAQLHEHLANQRRDYWHKVARNMVRQHDLIALEDMPLAFMMRNPHLALSAHDAGLNGWQQYLHYKAEEAGVRVVAVKPRNTSQACSGCGVIVPKGLSVRVHACPECGLTLDRDVNAARNILKLALNNPPGRGGQDSTWADVVAVRVLRSCRL